VADIVPANSWVEIHAIVLEASQRAPHLPEDTKQVPLEMRVKGFLVSEANLGEEVEIMTAAGRRLRGTLVSINPPYDHGFGAPIPELAAIGSEVRALLRDRGRFR
jgi:hypothetical protein